MYEADIMVVFVLQMKTDSKKQGLASRLHGSEASLHSYWRPSTSAKGLSFLHLKLKGWNSLTQATEGVWGRQWWRSWCWGEALAGKCVNSRWQQCPWSLWLSPTVLGKQGQQAPIKVLILMPDLWSLTCLPPLTYLLLSQVDCLTSTRVFPFLSLRNSKGRLGKMTQKSFTMETLPLRSLISCTVVWTWHVTLSVPWYAFL